MGADDMEARTPAPEGEAVAWVNQTTLNAIKERPKEAAWVWGLPNGSINIPLYASPVVPVGREVRKRLIGLHIEARPTHKDYANMCEVTPDGADAILAALRPTDTGWRDIATAPRDGTPILAFNPMVGFYNTAWTNQWTGHNPSADYEGFPCGFWGSLGAWDCAPTHWMPLPPAPTDTGRE